MDIAAMRQSADDAISRLREIRVSFSGEIADLRGSAAAAEAELTEFKRLNGIARQVRQPASRGMTYA